MHPRRSSRPLQCRRPRSLSLPPPAAPTTPASVTPLAIYCFEERNVPEIARVFGVSQSRVCQIHEQALRTLRAACAEPLGLAA